jgi:putative endonuclease
MSLIIGKHYEETAHHYLEKQGLRCIKRNYRCRFGEIDWIGFDQKILVFAEIRYRLSADSLSPFESVHFYKQRKIALTAEHYLQHAARNDRLPCRFDVVSIKGPAPLSIEWMQDAFTLDDCY